MGRMRDWWTNSSLSTRLLMGAGGLLVVGSLWVIIWQADSVSNLRADLAATEAETEVLDSAAQALTTDLAEAQQQLTSAEQRVLELEETITVEEAALADAAVLAETLKSGANDQLEEAERSLAEALADKEQAEKLVAELTLSYSDDIDAARTMVAVAATSFVCEWGTAQATDGKAISSVTSEAALSAFAASPDFTKLTQSPGTRNYLSIATTLGEDRYGLNSAEIESIAIGCWQSEDAKLNATLYEAASVLRDAALDAACTQRIDGVFGRFDGYEDTAVYQNWQLSIGGYIEARDYIEAVEDQFGSVEAFLAIPEADLQAESDRCADFRRLISPKSSGTHNVGDEIKPGTWKAYDVSDCYWARLAVNGDIRANQFGDALRLTVNVSPSDGQFEVSGCTFYYENP